jgi:uncharacterized protein YbaR (Trm112 family)
MTIVCPHCSRRLNAQGNLAGKQVSCPVCHKPFRISDSPVHRLRDGEIKETVTSGASIMVACPQCKKRLRLDRRLAGGQITCPACKSVFSVPGPPPQHAKEAGSKHARLSATSKAESDSSPATRSAASRPPPRSVAPAPAGQTQRQPSAVQTGGLSSGTYETGKDSARKQVSSPSAALKERIAKGKRGGDLQDFIHFVCECGSKISVPKGFAGRKGKCNKCGRIISIPDTSAVRTPPAAHTEPQKRPRVPRLAIAVTLAVLTVGLGSLLYFRWLRPNTTTSARSKEAARFPDGLGRALEDLEGVTRQKRASKKQVERAVEAVRKQLQAQKFRHISPRERKEQREAIDKQYTKVPALPPIDLSVIREPLEVISKHFELIKQGRYEQAARTSQFEGGDAPGHEWDIKALNHIWEPFARNACTLKSFDILSDQAKGPLTRPDLSRDSPLRPSVNVPVELKFRINSDPSGVERMMTLRVHASKFDDQYGLYYRCPQEWTKAQTIGVASCLRAMAAKIVRSPADKAFIKAIKNIGDPAVEEVGPLVLSRSKSERALAIDILAAVATQRSISALDGCTDERAIPILVKLVKNPAEDKDARMAAAHALGAFRNGGIAPLIDILNVSFTIPPPPGSDLLIAKLHEVAAFELSTFGPDAVPHLLRLLRQAGPSKDKYSTIGCCLYALARIGDPRAQEVIKPFCQHPDRRISAEARNALSSCSRQAQ